MISVIMPVYNAEKFIHSTIKSILEQTYSNFELIIVNDGSSDDSEKVIQIFTDPRIRYFSQSNKGPSSARNFGLQQCKGDFVLFHDADDMSVLNRFEKLLGAFHSPQVGFVHSDIALIDEKDHIFSYLQREQVLKEDVLPTVFKFGTPYANGSILYRREAIGDTRYDEDLHIGEDTNFVCEIAMKTNSVHIPLPLLFYRRHADNLSNRTEYHRYSPHILKLMNQYKKSELMPEVKDEEILRGNILSAYVLFKRLLNSDAIKIIQDSLGIAQSDDEKLFVLGTFNLMNGNAEKALSTYLKIVRQDEIIINLIGECYALMGKNLNAESYFRRSLELNPTYAEPLYNLKHNCETKQFNYHSSWMVANLVYKQNKWK